MKIINIDVVKNILVIGANGKVGRLFIKYLVSAGKKVRAMIRTEEKVEEIQQLEAEPYLGNLEKDFSSAFEKIDCVIFTAGSGSHTGHDKTILVDQEGAKKSIDYPVQAGIQKYIMVSAQGARDPEIPGKIQHYYKAKRIADDYLIKSGLKYTIFRPGKLLDDKGNLEIKVSSHFKDNGTTCRNSLALTVIESIDISNTDYRTLEIFDGERNILDTLNTI